MIANIPELLSKALSIIYRSLSNHLIQKIGVRKASAHTGAVTLIQRFGSAQNLNVDFDMLFLDSEYGEDARGKANFHRVKVPTQKELRAMATSINTRGQPISPEPYWTTNQFNTTAAFALDTLN